MPSHPSQEPSPVAKGVMWAHRITTISLEMVLPAWGGIWLDNKYDTKPWFFFLGAVLGFGLALYHLVQIGRQSSGSSTGRPASPLKQSQSPASPRSASPFPAVPEPPGDEKTE